MCLLLFQMLSFMHAQHSLFQQGYNLLDQIDPYMKKLAAEVRQCTNHIISLVLHIQPGLVWSGRI